MGWIEESTGKVWTVDNEKKIIYIHYPHEFAESWFEEIKKGNPWPVWNYVRETLPSEILALLTTSETIINRWILDRIEIRYV